MIITDLIILANRDVVGMVATAKGKEKKKGGGGPVLPLHMPCWAHSLSLLPVSIPRILSVLRRLHHSHAMATVLRENQHWGINISLGLMHHLLKDFHRLHCCWLQPQDSIIALFRAENALWQNNTGVSLRFSALIGAVCSIPLPCPYTLQRTSIPSLKDYVPSTPVDQI